MGASFLKAATRPVVNVKGFLADTTETTIKYQPEMNKRHLVYIPYVLADRVNEETGATETAKDLVAIYANIHEMTPAIDKYESTICLDGVIYQDEETGELINDGTCPFCARVGNSWDIRNYRRDQEEINCGKTGEELVKHMDTIKRDYANQRKVREAKPYVYILIVKFKLNDNNTPVIGEDGLPEYELKVQKLSKSRITKIKESIENSGIDFTGCEIIYSYPKTDSIAQSVAQCSTSPLFGDKCFTKQFAGLKEKIDNEVAKFKWDGVENAFRELRGYSKIAAVTKCNDLFKSWDTYTEKLNEYNQALSSGVVVSEPPVYSEYAMTGAVTHNPELASTVNLRMPSLDVPSGMQMGVPTGDVFAGMGDGPQM